MIDSWQNQKLGTFVSIKTGKKDVDEGHVNGEYPFFTCAKEIYYSNSYSFDTEAILIAGNGAVGETKYYKGKFEAYQRTYVLCDFKGVDPFFLYLFLKGKLIAELQKFRSGSTMPYIKIGDLENIVVPLPPVSTQIKIADWLNEIQEMIKKQKEVINSSYELKTALMRSLFKHGENKTLSEIAKIERGKFSHRPRNDPDYYGGDIPFIQTSDVVNSNGYIKKFSQTLNERGLAVSKVFPKGTLVITIAANIGHTGILTFDSAFPDSLIAIIPIDNKINIKYLNYYLKTQQTQMDKLASRGTQKNINIQFLSSWQVKIPDIAKQQEIVDILSVADEKIELEQQKKDLYQELFSSMLDKLMLGEFKIDN